MSEQSVLDKQIREYLLPQCFNAAVKAGAAIMKVYKSDDYHINLKSDHTPITLADRMAHNTIKECLGPTRIPVLSEEGREMLFDERRNWEMFLLVDPLDGTKEFIKGNNEFTVNIALMMNNECIASALYVPYHRKMYVAARGQGAYLIRDIIPQEDSSLSQNQIEQMMERLPLSSAAHTDFRVAVSRSHQTPETHERIEQLRQQQPDLQVIEQGSSYKFCLLAEGTIDYYVRTTNTYEWDTAAGELILAEAGGSTLSYPEGKPLGYNKEDLQNPWFEARSASCKL